MHTALSVPASRSGAHLTPVSAPTQERFLRLPEVIHQCGLSRSTLYDLIARDAFPAQVSLGGKTSPGSSLKSPRGCRNASLTATGNVTHESEPLSKSPFFWLASVVCFLVQFSCCRKIGSRA